MKLQNIILLALLFIYSICSAQHKNEDTLVSQPSNGKQSDFNTKFNEILSAYIQVKNALVNNDANAASSAAVLITKAVDAVNTKSLNNKQLLNWTLYAEKISFDADHIKGTPEVVHQREYFMSLSKNLYELAKALNVNNDELYYQFCPMANDGKGAYWLSEQLKIRNPYYGKKMLSCGSNKVTLPATKQ
jgi:hypothetical protein